MLLVVWLSLCLYTGNVHQFTAGTAQRIAILLTQLPSMRLITGQHFLLTSLIAGAVAHDNGMVMSMDQGMSMSSGNMIAYLHFTPGDNFWFIGWAPRTAGAMIGACIALFMLSIAERWLAAMRGVMEAHWRTRLATQSPCSYCHLMLHWSCSAQVVLADRLNTSAVATSPEERIRPSSSDATQPRPGVAPPFVVTYDVPRGIMEVVLASINFLLMLTVM